MTFVTTYFDFKPFLCIVKIKVVFVFVFLLQVQSLLADSIVPKISPIKFVRVIHSFDFGTRYFFMNTQNSEQLETNFFANGLNTELNYSYSNLLGLLFKGKIADSTLEKHYLRLNAGYSHILNLNSSDLSLGNRYEIGLFDIQNPSLKSFGNLNRLHFFYSHKNFEIAVGRIIPMNPFLNAQDGRLRPTYIQGVQSAYVGNSKNAKLKYTVEFNFATDILARSTAQWKSLNSSIGIYPQGVSVSGKPAQYNQINTTFGNVVLYPAIKLNYQYSKDKKSAKSIGLNHHVLYMNRLMLTNMVTLIHDYSINEKFNVGISAMWIHQKFLVDSTGLSAEKRYAETNEISNVYSGQFSLNYKILKMQQSLTLAVTHISKDGRYLMPREWGRDPFFTFMPRERNEGLGNVQAYTINYQLNRNLIVPNAFLKSITLDMGYGNYKLPDVKNYTLNKYGMPSYEQVNVALNFIFGFKTSVKGFKKNLFNLKFWYIQKINSGNTYDLNKYITNKVDMSQVNIVLNYFLSNNW